MRYINLRLTYLLTYLHSNNNSSSSSTPLTALNGLECPTYRLIKTLTMQTGKPHRSTKQNRPSFQ